MSLRTRDWMVALLATVLMAALPARAQQPQQEPPPSSDQSLPGRVIEGIGGAIRDIFRSIFGQSEGELPTLPQDARPAPSQDGKEQEPAAPTVPAAAAAPQPVAVSPKAAAAPQSLQAAIARGDYANALKMIEGGTDIEAKDPGAGASALHYAVMKGEMPLVGLLVQRGADVNSRTKSGTTPLHTAVLYGRYEVAEYLLDKGSEVNAKSAGGATPLSLADAAHFQRIAKLLRERGAR